MVILIADILAAGITWPTFVIGLMVIALAIIGLGMMADHDNKANNKLTEDMIPDEIKKILEHECTVEYRPTGTMEWTSDPSMEDRISEVRCKLHPKESINRWSGETAKYFRSRVTEWWECHRAEVAIEAYEAGNKFGAEIMKENPPVKVPTSEPKMEKLWIQYAYTNVVDAAVMQTANSKKEAKRESGLFPSCPWFSYDIRPPGGGKAGDLINEEGPFYFGTIPDKGVKP